MYMQRCTNTHIFSTSAVPGSEISQMKDKNKKRLKPLEINTTGWSMKASKFNVNTRFPSFQHALYFTF